MYSLTPKYPRARLTPMNSVAMVRKFKRNRSPTDHFLIDDQDRDQQWEGPQERETEVLTSLGVGRNATGVVVANHDDQPGTHDGEQHEHSCPPRPPPLGVVLSNRPERALDVAKVRLVEYRCGDLGLG